MTLVYDPLGIFGLVGIRLAYQLLSHLFITITFKFLFSCPGIFIQVTHEAKNKKKGLRAVIPSFINYKYKDGKLPGHAKLYFTVYKILSNTKLKATGGGPRSLLICYRSRRDLEDVEDRSKKYCS